MQTSTGVYFGLNPVGSFLWERMQGGATVNELVGAAMERYDSDQHAIESDVRTLLCSLQAEGLIKLDVSGG